MILACLLRQQRSRKGGDRFTARQYQKSIVFVNCISTRIETLLQLPATGKSKLARLCVMKRQRCTRLPRAFPLITGLGSEVVHGATILGGKRQ
jgi:hypothetical protein